MKYISEYEKKAIRWFVNITREFNKLTGGTTINDVTEHNHINHYYGDMKIYVNESRSRCFFFLDIYNKYFKLELKPNIEKQYEIELTGLFIEQKKVAVILDFTRIRIDVNNNLDKNIPDYLLELLMEKFKDMDDVLVNKINRRIKINKLKEII